MTTALRAPSPIVAHRGFSARQPEMTLAAYREAIAWSVSTGVGVGLECDVQFSRDGQLVCLHDRRLGRTCSASGRVRDWTVPELREVDFGSWKVPRPSSAQQTMVTLADLLALVYEARLSGADVTLVVETKHFGERSLDAERRVCQMLADYGWDRAGAPVRLITFSTAGAALLAQEVPEVDRALLIQHSLRPYRSGVLPPGVRVAGVEMRLLRRDPGFVARAQWHGNAVHAWTVNEPEDVEFCRANGVSGYTTDCPDRVLAALS